MSALSNNKENLNSSSKSNNNKEVKDDDNQNILDVVIIGAGWAGLGAAKALAAAAAQVVSNDDDDGSSTTKKRLFRIKLLEGRHEIGGRCRTQVLQDGVSVVELGAQWIHGARKNNPVYQAALASGIDMARSLYSSQIVYQEQSQQQQGEGDSPTVEVATVSEDKLDHMIDTLFDGENGFFQYQEKRQDEDDRDISLRQCADEYLLKIDATEEQRTWLNFFLDSNISQEYSGSLEDMSMFWWDSDEDIQGGDVHVPQNVHGGYRGILDHFVKDIRIQGDGDDDHDHDGGSSDNDHDWIQFNSKVTSIDWNSLNDDNLVMVQYTQFGQRKSLTARKVLITVPIGVLQAQSIQFTPPLPQAKQRAIGRIGNGLYNKCVFLWDEKDADCLPWPQDKEWIEKIVSSSSPSNSKDRQGLWTEFFNSQPVTERPMLCAFTAGRIAQEMEQYSDQEIGASALEALRALFPGTHIPNPVQVVVTKWSQDEFARGSYSFNAIGGKHSDRKQLAAPVEQKLYFAGEACHSQYFGTTHGALMSGVSSARLIMQQTNNKAAAAKATKRNVTRTRKHGNSTTVKSPVMIASAAPTVVAAS